MNKEIEKLINKYDEKMNLEANDREFRAIGESLIVWVALILVGVALGYGWRMIQGG